jgi:8-oxo-dGTP pyrophosphatase MutT (NUDIX family)
LVPEYLMVQRKDSLCYVEFIRAKYSLQNRQYLMKLFSSMTPQERHRIETTPSFDALWFGFWHNDACMSYMKEYQHARDKFHALKQGFYLRCQDTCSATSGGAGGANGAGGKNRRIIFFSLGYLLENTRAEYEEPEWGWPKGRRNINESDLACALREFTEETSIPTKDISVLTLTKPFEEVFSGCNHVRYRHVYFLAILTSPKEPSLAIESAVQAQEIGCLKWCRAEEVTSKIRHHNVERLELFKRIHGIVQTNVLNIALMPKNRNQE